MTIKDRLIKQLGGYTAKEYERNSQRYQALLDSKTDFTCLTVVNNYLEKAFRTLDYYARNELYGLPLEQWCSKMYNVIHNNYYRILTRYTKKHAAIPYKVDTTLEKPNQFIEILKEDGDEDALQFILETD